MTRIRTLVLGAGLATAAVLSLAASPSGPAADFIHWMNLGKAQLENKDSARAIDAFTRATALDPKSAPALRNLARAHFLAREYEAAFADLGRAARLERESAATSYLAGLACAHLTRSEESVAHFESAARLDPGAAALRYQLARAYEATGQDTKALEQLGEAVRLDPLHAAAHFKLATYAREAGDPAEFRRQMDEFTRLKKLLGNAAREAELLEQCAHTRPEAPPVERGRTAVAIPVRFREAELVPRVTAAAVLEIDETGRPALLVAEPGGALAFLGPAAGGGLERTPVALELPAGGAVEGLVAGDFQDDVPKGARYDPKRDALTDALLIRAGGVRLLKRTGPAAFADVTEAAGLAKLAARRARWIDFEHDGDLDLAAATASGVELWQNNGDGTFRDMTAEVGLGAAGPAADLAGADLDADVAVDLVVARAAEPTLLYRNQRTGRFAPTPEPPGPWPAAARVLLDDVTNDGHPDAVLVGATEVNIILGGSPARQHVDLGGMTAAAAVLIDYDNDGWLDVCAAGTRPDRPGQAALLLARNAEGTGWEDVTMATGLDSLGLPPPAGLVAVDLDADSDSDLLLLAEDGGMRFLRNDGGHAGGQLKLRLVTLKTNPSGIGTHLELRSGDFWLAREVTEPTIQIGLGGRTRIESIQTVWTTGVVENQIEVAVGGAPVTVVEKDVETGSCPLLYASDGGRLRFVTDLLGNSPVGLPLRRGVKLPADPDEIVAIGPAGAFAPAGGAYTVLVTEEFREVLYLDQAKLIAVDHPAAVEVHPTDKIMPPPFPPSELWALGARRPLAASESSDGADRTRALAEIDGVFAPPGLALPPPYCGMTELLALALDFGPLDPAGPLVLALTGWLQYGSASIDIAISQNASLAVVPPTLEAEIDGGHRERLEVIAGMPAGKTKTIVCDLAGKLPAGTRRLVLSTTYEIRWDRIALFERAALPPAAVHEVLPASAELAWYGFSDLRARAPGHPTTPDPGAISSVPPWRTAVEGWCTSYGDGLAPIRDRDDRLAILNAGDGLTLRFEAAAFPPPPPGQERTFFFYSFGWCKDADHNVIGGESVAPLPVASDEADLETLTRWVPRDRFAP